MTQSSARFGPFLTTLGLGRIGFAFTLFVPDFLHLGLFLFLQSLAQFGLFSFVSDFLHSDLPLSSQQIGQIEPSFPVLGSACLGLLSFLPVADHCLVEFSMFPRGPSKPGSLVLASDCIFDPILFLRSSIRLGTFSSYSGRVECDASRALSVISFAMLGASLLAQSSVCLDSATSVLSFSQPDLLPFPQSLAWLDLPSVVMSCRASRTLPILDTCSMDVPFPTRSLSHLALFLPVLSFNAIGFFLLVRTPFCTGLSFLLNGRRGFAPPILDLSFPEISLLSRSCAYADSSLLLFSSIGAGSLLLLQSPSRTGSPVFAVGVQRVGPIFATSIVHSVSLETLIPSHGLARPESLLFASDMASLDLGLPLKGICKVDLVLSLSFSSRLGFPLLAPSSVQSELFALPQGFAYLGSLILVMTSLVLEPSLPPQSLSQGGFATSAFGSVKLDLLPLILDPGNLGLFFSPRSIFHLSFPPVVYRIAAVDFSLLVLDVSKPEPVLFLKGCGRIGSFLSVPGCSSSHFGLLLASRKVLWSGSQALPFGAVWLESLLSAPGLESLDSLLFFRNLN